MEGLIQEGMFDSLDSFLASPMTISGLMSLRKWPIPAARTSITAAVKVVDEVFDYPLAQEKASS